MGCNPRAYSLGTRGEWGAGTHRTSTEGHFSKVRKQLTYTIHKNTNSNLSKVRQQKNMFQIKDTDVEKGLEDMGRG